MNRRNGREIELTFDDLLRIGMGLDPEVIAMRADHLNKSEGLDPATALGMLLGFIPTSEPKKNNTKKCNCTNKCNKNANKTVSRKSYDDTPRLTNFVDKIIAQDTATIIFWKDGTKTSVKCNEVEAYDYEKGIAMAVLKYVFGNRYYKDIQKLMEAFPHTKTEKQLAIEAKAEADKLALKAKSTKKSDTKKSTKKPATSKKAKSVKVEKEVEKTDSAEKTE